MGRTVPLRPVQTCECGDHGWLVLTQGYIALIDPEFATAVGLWCWKVGFDGRQQVYAVRSHHQWFGDKRKTITVRLHAMIHPVPAGYVVDHINRNTLDNRRRNLRLALISQNAMNSKKRAATTSIYKGVSGHHGRWRATIGCRGRQQYIGTFATEMEAAMAYDQAAKEYHGSFASLNFPTDEAA